jgi:uncharacterized membrane protein YcaP (DUF421 family)
MDTIVRALVIYFVLLVIFRIAGKRSLAQITTFDLVLALIVGETVEGALVGDDQSLTNAVLLVLTLVGVDLVTALVKQRFPLLARVLEGLPVLVVENGSPHPDRLDRERIDRADILEAARQQQGLGRMEQIDYAVVEPNGEISVIPKEER